MTRAQTHSRSPLAVVRFSRSFLLLIASAVSLGIFSPSRTASAGEIPTFAVDASWPKQLPNNWILGQVGGITVDWQGHIWVIHRPRSLTDDEKGATLNAAALEMLRPGAAGAGIRRRRQSAARLGRSRRRL